VACEIVRQVVLIDLAVLLECGDDGDRHHSVICESPGRQRQGALGDASSSLLWRFEKTFPESISARETF
jgi:hypothetical protein